MKIVEINDNDIFGKVFNGYDIMENLNCDSHYNVKQLVIQKYSNNSNVIDFTSSIKFLQAEELLHSLEHDIISVHSLLSLNTLLLQKNKYYNDSDLVHFHQIHNCHFSLPTLFNMFKQKPTVVSLHDPWFLTGKCVWPYECNMWRNNCKNCKNLTGFFNFTEDNCNEMFKIKNNIVDTDIDIIVHSKYMYDMVKQHSYLNKMRIHLLEFGIDMSKYQFNLSKEEAKQKLGIHKDDIVIFFRENEDFKGTNYIVSALKKMYCTENITLLTCSEKGLLGDLENRYNVVELGYLDENEMLLCYNAADLFVMASPAESFGMMAVEAMASGITTIVFDNTALPDTTGAPDYGVLVKNLDTDDLRDKIEYFATNHAERIKRGELSKKYVQKKYDINKYYSNVKKIYDKAYEQQKYKIKSVSNKIEFDIDLDNQNSVNLINKLNMVYNRMFFNNDKCWIDIDNNHINEQKIKFSSKENLNIIEKFNYDIYKKIMNTSSDLLKYDNKSNSSLPLVSIIIPVYNGENYVSLAIESALRQTYKNIEIIVVNDGSTDGTDKICRSYGNLIRYFKKENGGVSTALNLGIKNMKGDYFSWLSHDDLYFPNKIEDEIKYLMNSNLLNSKVIMYSDYTLIDQNGKLIDAIKLNDKFLNSNSAFSLLTGGIDGLSLLIPKNAFYDAGFFDLNLRCVQDYKLWFDMYKKGYKFIHIPSNLVMTRIHSKSVTNNSPHMVKEGNEFWVNLLNHFDDKEKCNLLISPYFYYYYECKLLYGGPYDAAIELCQNNIKKIENKVKKELCQFKVSIVIIYKNNIYNTLRTIKSILNQSFKNVEIILVNNSTSIETNSIDKLVKQNYDKFKCITYTKEQSFLHIVSDCLDKITGHYTCFLDENAYCLENRIEKQLHKMVCSKLKISHTSYYFDENDNKIDVSYLNGYIDLETADLNLFDISNVMFKTEYLKNNIKKIEKRVPKNINSIIFLLSILCDEPILGIEEPLTVFTNKNINLKTKIQDHCDMCSFKVKNIILPRCNKYTCENLYDNLNNGVNILRYNREIQILQYKDEIERYSFLLSKEYKLIKFIRNIKNALFLKKKSKQYEMTYLQLRSGLLVNYVNKCSNLIRRIKFKIAKKRRSK